MYNVGDAFHQAAAGNGRQILVRATFDDVIIVDGSYIQSLTINDSVNTGEALTLGNTCSKQLTLNMYMPPTLTPNVIRSAKIFIEIGFLNITNKINALDTKLYVDEILGYLYQSEHTDGLTFSLNDGVLSVNGAESGLVFALDGNEVVVSDNSENVANATFWLPMGVFYTDKVETRNDYLSVSVSAFDGMCLLDRITEDFNGDMLRTEPPASEVIEGIAEVIGVECDIPLGLPNENVGVTKTAFIKGSYRKSLGYFASFLGCNAAFTRTGKLTVKPYETVNFNIAREQQYLGSLSRTVDDALTISSITCQVTESPTEPSQGLNFSFGWWNESTHRFVDTFYPPTGEARFYSGLIPVVPGQTYTLTRSSIDKPTSTVDIFGYVINHHGIPKYQNASEIIDNYTPMSYNQKTYTFKLKDSVEDIRYIRVLPYDVNYRTNSAGYMTYYTMSNSYNIKRVSTDNIQIGAGHGIAFTNPLIYETSLLQPIFDYYNNKSYLACTVKYRGDPSIDAGDIITAETKSGDPISIIVTSQVFKISGGMNCTITSTGTNDSDTSVSASARYSGNGSSPTTKSDTQQKEIEELKARVAALEGIINGSD